MESESAATDHAEQSPASPEESKAAIACSIPLPKTEPNTFLGKHRMAAAISHLQNQITCIQEELNELDKLGESSIVCKELISSVEFLPDPLLPLTKGPANMGWDRWFRGTLNSRKCWI